MEEIVLSEKKSLRGELVAKVLERCFEEVISTEINDEFDFLGFVQIALNLHLNFKTEIIGTNIEEINVTGYVAFKNEHDASTVINFDCRFKN